MTDDKDKKDNAPARGSPSWPDDNPLFPPEWVTISAEDRYSATPSWRDPSPATLAALPSWESLPQNLREGIMLTYGLWLSERVGLPLIPIPPREAICKLGLDWEEVLRLMPLFEQKLREEARGRGRPPKAPDTAMAHPGTKAVMWAVRDYLTANPGCATVGDTGQRHTYSDAFKTFVLGLLGPDGPGHGMTLEQAEYATGVSAHTLTAWRQACRTPSSPK